MEQGSINLLTLNQFHLIKSDITKKPYIDKNGACYMFALKSEATAFCNEIPNISFGAAESYKQAVFCTEFYALGIDRIKIKLRDNKDFIEVPVEEGDAKRQYYNHVGNQLIARLKQTNAKKYLRAMKKTPFLSPVMINPRSPKQYPQMHYCYAIMKDEQKHFLLFTTLQEFEEWNKTQGNKWNAIEVNAYTFGRIRDKNPVLINPLTDKIALSDKYMKIILEKEKT